MRVFRKVKLVKYTSSKTKFSKPYETRSIEKHQYPTLQKGRERFSQLAIDLWKRLYGEESLTESFLSHVFNKFDVIKVDDKHYKIVGLFTDEFKKDLVKHINKGSKLLKIFDLITERKFIFLKKTFIILHAFFIPELYALLLDLYAKTGKKKYAVYAIDLKSKTWLRVVDSPSIKTKLDWSRLDDIKWSLKSFQKEFIEKYPLLKDRLLLRGYILAFDQGLGKTFTSLVLMHLLKKDLVVIVCPKTLMFNWKNEIQNIFKDPPADEEIYLVGETPKITPKVKYVIVNYERIDKLVNILSTLNRKQIGLIVDESQNFRNIKTKRSQNLIHVTDTFKQIDDILLLSGTPIKSNYAELATYLRLIDPRFDDEALSKWLKVFNIDMSIASDIIRYRLQLISFRRLKTDVLQLPEKKHEIIYVTIPNVDEYTLDAFKQYVRQEIQDRLQKYESQFETYYSQFLSLLDVIKSLAIKYNQKELSKEIDEYKTIISQTKRGKLLETLEDKQLKEQILKIEHDIESFLSEHKYYKLKKQFINLKTLVTRITYRVFGEALGKILHEKRSQMVYEIYKYNIDKVCELINQSTKTIIFTYSTSVVPKLASLIEKHCKVNVVYLTGEIQDRKSVVEKFKKDPNVKVLIASYQVASTGLTLTEADTMIYADKPYREADLKQAEDRIYRIGQDKPVKIIYLKLKSRKKTLQDRIDEIVKYFGNIVKLVMNS